MLFVKLFSLVWVISDLRKSLFVTYVKLVWYSRWIFAYSYIKQKMQKNNCYITGDWWYTQNLSHRIASHRIVCPEPYISMALSRPITSTWCTLNLTGGDTHFAKFYWNLAISRWYLGLHTSAHIRPLQTFFCHFHFWKFFNLNLFSTYLEINQSNQIKSNQIWSIRVLGAVADLGGGGMPPLAHHPKFS